MPAWTDLKQTSRLNADGTNGEIRLIKREDGSVVHGPKRWQCRAI
jgi:hypothetical protein